MRTLTLSNASLISVPKLNPVFEISWILSQIDSSLFGFMVWLCIAVCGGSMPNMSKVTKLESFPHNIEYLTNLPPPQILSLLADIGDDYSSLPSIWHFHSSSCFSCIWQLSKQFFLWAAAKRENGQICRQKDVIWRRRRGQDGKCWLLRNFTDLKFATSGWTAGNILRVGKDRKWVATRNLQNTTALGNICQWKSLR